MDTLGIKVDDVNIPTQGIKIIRAETEMSISDIKNRVAQRTCIIECDATDENGLALIIRLFNKLTRIGIVCTLYEHNRVSSIEFFKNLTNMYSEINKQVDEIIDHEDSNNL